MVEPISSCEKWSYMTKRIPVQFGIEQSRIFGILNEIDCTKQNDQRF